MSRAVVVTGIGSVTPCGTTAGATWSALLDGASGVGGVERFDLFDAPTTVAGFVPGYEAGDPDGSLALEFGRTAAAEALAQAGIDPADGIVDTAVVATHGERRSPCIDRPAIVLGVGGVTAGLAEAVGTDDSLAVYGACAAGGQAVCVATAMIRRGHADVVVAGGTDSLLRDFDFFQFCNLYAMSTRECPPSEASCPFDARRDGFVLGEGAGFLVLEAADHAAARGAEPLASVAGFGMSQNAYHMISSPPDAEGPTRAIAAALADAAVDPDDVGYLNAHGTSTRDNDWCETLAIRRAFGSAADDLMVSSTKSVMGHPMAAAGAIELVVAVQALRAGAVPPTINLEEPDPNCDLDYVPGTAREVPLTHTASNSFGFGGHNTCVVLARA